MRGLWSETRKFEIWLGIELLASEALVKEGIVPKDDFAKIKHGVELCLADTKALTLRAKELEEAALLAEFNESLGLDYNPSDDKFVFSTADLAAYRDRKRRLEAAIAARNAPRSGPNRPVGTQQRSPGGEKRAA